MQTQEPPDPPAWRCWLVPPAGLLLVALAYKHVLIYTAEPASMGRFLFVSFLAAPAGGLMLALYDALTRRGSKLVPLLALPVFGLWLVVESVVCIGLTMQFGSLSAGLERVGADLIARDNPRRAALAAQAPRPRWGQGAAPAPASAASASPVPVELVSTQIVRLQDPVNAALTLQNSSPAPEARRRLAQALVAFYRALPAQSLQEPDFILFTVYDALDKLDDPAVLAQIDGELASRLASTADARSRAVLLGDQALLELNMAALHLSRARRLGSSSFDAVFPRWSAAAALWRTGRATWSEFLAAAQSLGPLPADEAKSVAHLKDAAIYGLGGERDLARLERAVSRARADKAFVEAMRAAFLAQAPGGVELARLKAAAAAAPDVEAVQLALAEQLSWDPRTASEAAAAASRAVAVISSGEGCGAEPEGRALARAYGLLATAQKKLGQLDAARRSAEQALKLDADEYHAQRVRGELAAGQALAH